MVLGSVIYKFDLQLGNGLRAGGRVLTDMIIPELNCRYKKDGGGNIDWIPHQVRDDKKYTEF